MMLSLASSLAAEYSGVWSSGKGTLNLARDNTASFSYEAVRATGIWSEETEGKFAGTLKVALKNGDESFTLFFQPDGEDMICVNTDTVAGVYLPDDKYKKRRE